MVHVSDSDHSVVGSERPDALQHAAPAQSSAAAAISYPIEVTRGDWRARGTTAEEVVALLIEGYAQSSDEESRREARVRQAHRARGDVQDLLNAGPLFETCSPREREVLLGN